MAKQNQVRPIKYLIEFSTFLTLPFHITRTLGIRPRIARGFSVTSCPYCLYFRPPKDETDNVENPALETALKASESLVREQKAALSRTLEGFISCLAPSMGDSNPNTYSRSVIGEEAWNNRDAWGRDEWNAWETWGWYRQFVRAVCVRFLFFFTFLFFSASRCLLSLRLLLLSILMFHLGCFPASCDL